MCCSNKRNSDSLLKVIELWWPTRKENLSGLKRIDAKEIHRMVLTCLGAMREADDKKRMAEQLPTRIANEVDELCENAGASDRKRCAACVCMVVSACMTMINAATIGNRALMWAQSYLQHKMETFENVDALFDELWDCVEEVGAMDVAESARMWYEGEIAGDAECKEEERVSLERVEEVFVQPAMVEGYVREMVAKYYRSNLDMALIYCVLDAYGLIKAVGEFKLFVLALKDWGMLDGKDDKALVNLYNGVGEYFRDRKDKKGRIRPAITTDFRNWEDGDRKTKCESIASVYGDADRFLHKDGTLRYKYPI